jgi:hypothetical protein
MTESNTHSTDHATGPATDPATTDETTPAGEETIGGSAGDTLGSDAGNTTEKDPADWVTGDEPMTGAQRSYLDRLAREAGETLPASLTKAEASEHIERLQGRSDGS